jgi:hypothetical protein
VRLTCQACGAIISLDAALCHEGAREAVQIALQLPAPLGKVLVQYIALFRPEKRQLSMDRVSGLLGELLPMIEAGKIERNGKIFAAPQTYWQQALEDMLAKRDQLTLPLRSHGYLLTIIAGYADKAEAKAEQRAEDNKRFNIMKPGQTKAVKSTAPLNIGEHLKQLNQGGNDGHKA